VTGPDERPEDAEAKPPPGRSKPSSPDDGPEMPPLAFLFIFLGAPLILAGVAALAQLGDDLGSSPLGTALVVGHLLAAVGFVVFYVFYRRSRR